MGGEAAMRLPHGVLVGLAGVAALAAGCASVEPDDDLAPYADPHLDAITWSALEHFESERAFERYLERVREEAQLRGYTWWAAGEGTLYAQAETGTGAAALPCDPAIEDCPPPEEDLEPIVVTGSRVANPPITNVQEAGVDEGDIVKQIGDFLVVLQDGRLFSVDLRPGGAPGLRFAARADVYRSAKEDTWYDEMLVFGRRIVVAGYSYDENATEFSIFTLRDDGGFTRDAVFTMTTDDYYDVDNYATRLIGDRLVIYTPVELAGRSPLDPAPWPVVRRWRAEGDEGARQDDAPPLFDAREIYKPVQRTLLPVVHTVSVCPLDAAADAGDLRCESTAFVGPELIEFYVTTTDVWLWSFPGEDEVETGAYWDIDCEAGPGPGFDDGAPAALFRVPLGRGEPAVLGVKGAPWNQFALDASGGELRAMLLQWPVNPCVDDYGDQEQRLFRTPLRRLDARLADAPSRAYAPVPSPGGDALEIRFTESQLVYGSRDSWWAEPPEPDEEARSSRVVVAPIRAPADAVAIDTPHDIVRLERAGPHVVLTGYRDAKGLTVSALDMSGPPRIADSVVLAGRYESEGRSHAFNAAVDADGAGVIGLPTVLYVDESGRPWWRSRESDVSFLTLDAEARLTPVGELRMDRSNVEKSYVCEVSCVDWYGNSRPIFTGGRIFALSGTELIEGELTGGVIRELRRIDLTEPPPTLAAALR
jgi:hypothetical protein